MSSILTNTGAMVALQSLQSINSQLDNVQNQVSTGKNVNTASDNAAVWAISTKMNSDISSFTDISSNLSLGSSVVSVASQAATSIVGLLTTMKDKIISAQDSSADLTSLNNDVTALKSQISQVVGAASFNGVNLVDGTTPTINVLSTLARSSSGAITPSYINVSGQNLASGAYTAAAVYTGSTGVSTTKDSAAGPLNASGTATLVVVTPASVAAGDTFSVTIGGKTASYTVKSSDLATGNTAPDLIAVGLKNAIQSLGLSGLAVNYSSGTAGTLTLSNTGTTDLTYSAKYANAGSGGLSALTGLNVSTSAAASAALNSITTLINTATAAAAAFGSSSSAISSQSDFISKLTATLKTGVGTLVDADMEAASAKLQALQVQQQLGIQALSIANKSPQNLLSLFR